MKRLSKDERIGATAIAVVALGVCIAAFVFSRCKGIESGSKGTKPEISTIILLSDSIAESRGDMSEDSQMSKTHKNRRDSTVSRKKTSGKRKKEKSLNKRGKKKESKPVPVPRDFLNDEL